ncbi:MAG: tetratricopeptide repeat protein [bacterium]|nr:tetratricopeptide repeat protein [bacterium]
MQKRKSILLICLFACVFALYTKASNRDSLIVLSSSTNGAELAKLQLQIGLSYYQEGNTDSAIIWFEPSAKLSQKLALNEVFIRAQTNLGNCYANKGNNPMAMQHYQTALKLAEKTNNQNYIANIQKNIGALHLSWKNFSEALSYYNKAQKTALLLKDSNLLADCFNNKGTVYEQQENYPAALVSYGNALSFYEHHNLDDGIAMSSSNLAIVYKLMGNYNAAITYNQKALAVSQKIGDNWMSAAILNNIGNLYGQQGRFQEAKTNLEAALILARKIDAIEIIVMIYESLAEAANNANKNDLAYAYMKQFAAVKDSFISANQTAQFKELEVKYDSEKKEAQLQTQEAKINSQQIIILFSLLLSIAILFIGYTSYKRYQARKELEFNKKLQQQDALATQAIFESEQNERIRIARDLHDSIGQMLAVVKMNINAQFAQDKSNNSLAKNGQLIDQTIQELRHISHNLIPEELGLGLINGLEALGNKLIHGNALQINTQIHPSLTDKKYAKTFELSVFRIAQEVLNNMLKHAEASLINISLNPDPTNTGLSLQITDNGKGFDTTLIEQSQGLGWKNIKARVSLLNGQLSVRSEPNKGTNIQIYLPA